MCSSPSPPPELTLCGRSACRASSRFRRVVHLLRASSARSRCSGLVAEASAEHRRTLVLAAAAAVGSASVAGSARTLQWVLERGGSASVKGQ